MEAAAVSTRSTVRAVSTPIGLKWAMAVTAGLVVVFGVVATRAVITRHSAADGVVTTAAPRLLAAQDLYVALAAADAAASNIFLRAGTEPPELRQEYLGDLRRAGERLAAIAGGALGPDATTAASTIAEELPTYAGLVETARVNSRLEFPVGAAYLRRASELMRTTILPASTTIYRAAAVGLDGRYRSGTDASAESVVLVAAGAVVVAVGLAQAFVTWRSRRWLNAGLLVAVALVVGAALVTSVLLRRHADALVESHDEGADLVVSLSAARILTLRSVSDENLDLIERGTEAQYVPDFDRSLASIGAGGAGGLLGRAATAAPDGDTRAALDRLDERYSDYLAAHDEVRRLDYRPAVDAAVTIEAAAAEAVDKELVALIDTSRTRLDRAADRARNLGVVLPVLTALAALAAAAAVVIGLWPRLREYR